MTGIPLTALEKEEAERLLKMETSCTSGHQPGRGDHAVAKAVRRSRAA
jgi:hypothetical protein